MPTDLPPQCISVDAAGLRLPQALKAAGLAGSTSEATRKIEEGAVRIDGERVTDRALTLKPGTDVVLQLGSRRFARVKLEPRG